ncbi:T-cell immunomodulatory protein [Octopus sinensis]|uniref:T-cell immunomodulatory protein n=1 Tax=Octopus sinensis TaxID=2607531 RepID=A0A6P7S8P5_9MOLL|nr:T-cell immunomodulatory protein [Octopus sinensis]
MYSEARMKRRRRPSVELKTATRYNNVRKQLNVSLLAAVAVFFFVFQINLVSSELTEFSDISSGILVDGNDRGIVSAFGDFNADKHTDIFLLTDGGREVKLLLAGKSEEPYTSRILIEANASNLTDTIITSIVPADFDGDVHMDVLLCRQKENDRSGNVFIEIYWGNGYTVNQGNPYVLTETLKDQPLVMDANADMVSDLFGENSDGKRKFWFGSSQRILKMVDFPKNNTQTTFDPLKKPQSSAFVDLNYDFCADLCVVSVKNGKTQLEYWYYLDDGFQLNKTLDVPDAVKVSGQATFVNVDGDDEMDLLLPFCEDTECHNSGIYVYSEEQWHNLSVDFAQAQWRYVLPENADKLVKPPITLRAGDYNLDGYPDLLTVLTNQNHTQRVFLLKNVAFTQDNFTRTFSIDYKASFTQPTGSAFLAAFFDIDEDGVLDVFITSRQTDSKTKLQTFKNKFLEDAYFLKVMVVSGLCGEDCNVAPYGTNQPGPVVQFKTTRFSGEFQIGFATQLSQSAHYSLQLPYTVFGLGQSPNYIDNLKVGIAYYPKEKCETREWTSVIPNSRLIIIPHPMDDPLQWSNRLFVTPSRLVLLTGAALLGTCAFITAVVAILHWRERAEDKREKLQEAHKFHFDAM